MPVQGSWQFVILISKRADAGSAAVRANYVRAAKDNGGLKGDWDIKVYYDYKELLANKNIDAVHISLPDHQHAIVGVHAVNAGKDVYLQKPASLTIEEGRISVECSKEEQTGSFKWEASSALVDPWPQFKKACELVRNGRIGQLITVEVGLPGDPGGGDPEKMPVPETLNYDAWLGATPDSILYRRQGSFAGCNSTGYFKQTGLVALRTVWCRNDNWMGRSSY